MSNKILIAAAFALAQASAQAQQAPTTFDQIAALNEELKVQELRNKLAESKAKAKQAVTPSGATQSLPPALLPASKAMDIPLPQMSASAMPEDDLRLIAIYGVGKSLFADVSFNGTPLTVSAHTNANRLGVWKVREITAQGLTIVRTIKKKTETRTIQLGGPSLSPAPGAGLAKPLIPPIPMPPSPPATRGFEALELTPLPVSK